MLIVLVEAEMGRDMFRAPFGSLGQINMVSTEIRMA